MSFIHNLKRGYKAFTNRPEIIPDLDYSIPKQLDNIKASVVKEHLELYANFVIQPPKFNTFWTFYQIFPEVSTPINRIASRVAALSGRLYDDQGNVKDKETQELYARYNLRYLTEEFIQNILIYGQAIVVEFETEETKQKIQLVPSSEVTFWQANSFNISEFTWHWEYKTLNIEDSFRIIKLANVDSKFFGKSPLTSFYDDLSQLNFDRDNFNQFLRNNSFFGIAVIPKEGITKAEFDSLRNAVKQLNDPRTRYKAGVYQHTQEIKQIKQEIQARLSTEEKKYIQTKVSNAVGYPVPLLEKTTSGLGQGEQKTIMQNYKDETIGPLQDQVNEFINNYVLKEIATEFQGLHWKPNEMQVSTLEDMMKVANMGYASGLFSAYEAKTRFLGYSDEDVQDDDKFRKIGTQIIKEGELREGDSNTEEVQDENNENIKSIITAENIKEFISNQKTLNGNDKKRIKKFLEKVKKERQDGFSPAEIVIENDRAKMLEDMIKQAMIDQFKDIEFIINKKSLDADDSVSIEEVEEQMNPLANYLDVALLTYYINYLANLGKIDGTNQLDELDMPLTAQERAQINLEVQNYADRRVESLLGVNNGTPTSISDPLIPNSLDQTTVKLIAAILSMASTRKEVNELFNRRLDERVKLIRENEASTAYNAAVDIVAVKKTQIGYEWLRTRSAEPREIHLALVGMRAPRGTPINGEYPGVRINCKCGIRLIKLENV